MNTNFKRGAWVLAVAVGLGIGGAPALAIAGTSSQERQQDHETDYSKNKTYQQGMREGKADQARNRDHFKKRQFKKDDDRKAYEAGYQQGHR